MAAVLCLQAMWQAPRYQARTRPGGGCGHEAAALPAGMARLAQALMLVALVAVPTAAQNGCEFCGN